jgi:hypothetical protein
MIPSCTDRDLGLHFHIILLLPALLVLVSFSYCERGPNCIFPFALTPVRRTTKVFPTTTEVIPTAAEPFPTLLVHNRPARLALSRFTSLIRGLSWFAHGIALPEARLAPIATVEGLVLFVVFRTAVANPRAATVEEAVCTGARAYYAALGVA